MTNTLSSEYILVVDDTPTNLKVMVQTLSEEGYEVRTATSGERAIKQISYELPDLILLDIQMPGIDGFETCKRLKENPKTKDIPVVFMTALADSQSIVKGFRLGAVDYITKPFQAVEVLARVKTHIHLRKLRKNLQQEVAKKTNELTETLNELKASQAKLIQSEKMSALGELMTGVANELNHPIGTIYSNSYHIETYIKNLFHHLSLYQKNYPHPVAEIVKNAEEIDLNFLIEDFPKMVLSMKASSERIKYLSTSLQKFDKKAILKIHDSIDGTLLIMKHRLQANYDRPAIKVVKKYGDVLKIECFRGQLNQVFVNLISHAIHRINKLGKRIGFSNWKVEPQIVIETEMNQDRSKIIIIIKDNGIEIPEEVKQKVFEPVASNKDAGLSLSITHQIVVENHNGKVSFESTVNQGSEFILELPVE